MLEIYNETKIETPNINFLKIKNEILGENFELNISLLLGKNSKQINFKQRKQKYIPNTLSFKYSSNSGEIIFTPEIINSESYAFLSTFRKGGQKYPEKFLYLYIHSLLHLRNLDHGQEMEDLEVNYLERFIR